MPRAMTVDELQRMMQQIVDSVIFLPRGLLQDNKDLYALVERIGCSLFAGHGRPVLERTWRSLNEFVSDNGADELLEIGKKIEDIIAKNDEEVKKRSEGGDLADTEEDLGHLAFGELDANKELYGDAYETDSEYEKDLAVMLSDHLRNGQSLSKGDCNAIRYYIDGGYYKSIFVEPDSKHVYRGLLIHSDPGNLLEKLGISFDELKKNGTVKGNFTYVPRQPSSSWSKSEYIARVFSLDQSGFHDSIGITLVAEVDQGHAKFFDCENLYRLAGFAQYANEQEVVGFGEIKVVSIIFNGKPR